MDHSVIGTFVMRIGDESVLCGRWRGHIWGGVVMRCSNLLSLRRRMMCAILKLNRGTSCVVPAVGDFAEDLDCICDVLCDYSCAVDIKDSIEVCCVIGLKVSIRHILWSSVSSEFCGMSTQSWCVVARFPICALDGCGSVGDFAADIGRVLLCQVMSWSSSWTKLTSTITWKYVAWFDGQLKNYPTHGLGECFRIVLDMRKQSCPRVACCWSFGYTRTVPLMSMSCVGGDTLFCEWTSAETVCAGRRMMDTSEERLSRWCDGVGWCCVVLLQFFPFPRLGVWSFCWTFANSWLVRMDKDFAQNPGRVVLF